jgi:hypothetical protein
LAIMTYSPAVPSNTGLVAVTLATVHKTTNREKKSIISSS